MNKPIDYPLKSKFSDSGKDVRTSEMSYAMLRDRANSEKPVTDEMIRIARTKMDTAHAKKHKTAPQTKFKLNGIRNRFKSN